MTGLNPDYHLDEDYDPTDRCGEPSEDDVLIHHLEVQFHMPVAISQEQMHRLHKLIDEITQRPCNQPKNGVHWMCGSGCKPIWNEPEEPTFDDSVYFIETFARAFVSTKERDRVQKRRQKKEQSRWKN